MGRSLSAERLQRRVGNRMGIAVRGRQKHLKGKEKRMKSLEDAAGTAEQGGVHGRRQGR